MTLDRDRAEALKRVSAKLAESGFMPDVVYIAGVIQQARSGRWWMRPGHARPLRSKAGTREHTRKRR